MPARPCASTLPVSVPVGYVARIRLPLASWAYASTTVPSRVSSAIRPALSETKVSGPWKSVDLVNEARRNPGRGAKGIRSDAAEWKLNAAGCPGLFASSGREHGREVIRRARIDPTARRTVTGGLSGWSMKTSTSVTPSRMAEARSRQGRGHNASLRCIRSMVIGIDPGRGSAGGECRRPLGAHCSPSNGACH